MIVSTLPMKKRVPATENTERPLVLGALLLCLSLLGWFSIHFYNESITRYHESTATTLNAIGHTLISQINTRSLLTLMTEESYANSKETRKNSKAYRHLYVKMMRAKRYHHLKLDLLTIFYQDSKPIIAASTLAEPRTGSAFNPRYYQDYDAFYVLPTLGVSSHVYHYVTSGNSTLTIELPILHEGKRIGLMIISDRLSQPSTFLWQSNKIWIPAIIAFLGYALILGLYMRARLRRNMLTHDVDALNIHHQEILNASSEGIVVIDHTLSIDPSSFENLQTVMGKSPKDDANAITYLFAETQLNADEIATQQRLIENCFGQKRLHWLKTVFNLNRRIHRPSIHGLQTYHLNYKPIFDSQGLLTHIIILISNNTQIQQFRALSQRNRNQYDRLAEVLRIDDHLFEQFINYAKSAVQENRDHLIETDPRKIKMIHSHLHAITAGARLIHFQVLHATAKRALNYVEHIVEGLVDCDARSTQQLSDLHHAITREIDAYSLCKKRTTAGGDLNWRPYQMSWLSKQFDQFTKAITGNQLNTRDINTLQHDIEKLAMVSQQHHVLQHLEGVREHALARAERLNKKVVIKFVCDDFLLLPQALLGHASEVLQRLVTNAVDHSVNGDRTTMITINVDIDDKKACFSVRDNGEGIDAGKLDENCKQLGIHKPSQPEAVFLPKLKKSDTITTFGLGLFLCQQQISLIGGTIHYDFKDEAQSLFSFSFPIEDTRPHALFSLFDFQNLVEGLLKEIEPIAKGLDHHFICNTDASFNRLMFVDEWRIRKIIFNMIFSALTLPIKNHPIVLDISVFQGKRRIDSSEIFRISMNQEGTHRVDLDAAPYTAIRSELTTLQGRLSDTEKDLIALYIPSNLPDAVRQNAINIYVDIDDSALLRGVTQYIHAHLENWPAKLFNQGKVFNDTADSGMHIVFTNTLDAERWKNSHIIFVGQPSKNNLSSNPIIACPTTSISDITMAFELVLLSRILEVTIASQLIPSSMGNSHAV